MPTQQELTPEIDEAEDQPRPQRKFRNKRSWQLAILEQMIMPRHERSKDDRPVKPVELASILRTMDNRAREDGWYERAIEDTVDKNTGALRPGLATESHLSLRQCKRALEILLRKGWVERKQQPIRMTNGSLLWHSRPVYQELARTTTLPLWWETPGPECPTEGDLVPNQEPPRAQSKASECPIEPYRVPDSPPPRAHAGTQEAPCNRNLKRAKTSDTDVEGGRCFSFDEEDEIERLAMELKRCGIPAIDPRDREILLKTAMLRFRGRLTEQVWGTLREAMDSCPRGCTPWQHFWGVMRNQCSELLDESFEKMLATIDFPVELLKPRANRQNRRELPKWESAYEPP